MEIKIYGKIAKKGWKDAEEWRKPWRKTRKTGERSELNGNRSEKIA